MKLTRTAGPIGRMFGFSLEIGPAWLSFNSGWYILSLGWNGAANLYISKYELTAWVQGADGFSFGSDPEGTR